MSWEDDVGHCDECGFRYDDVATEEIGGRLRTLPLRYETVLRAAGDSAIRTHPLAGVWSALEYTCHVRDVLVVQGERLARALVEDRPAFAPMGRDERVVRDRYNEQRVDTVLAELAEAAACLADAFDALDGTQRHRVGVYPYPTPEERSMTWLGRTAVHEGVHHLLDIERVLRAS